MTYFWILFSFMVVFDQRLNGEPNFVIIITDDQDLLLHGMLPMTNTINLVANEGKIFENAFVNTPICCPSRSTILTGKFAHNTGVVNNSLSGNCSSPMWQRIHEPHTIAATLKKSKNYVTYYSGKYLNEYGSEKAGGLQHIPKGYDWWIGLEGNSKYYNYNLSINGTGHFFNEKYLTDALAGYSLTFLDKKEPGKPFFMIIAPPAPHAPFTPAKRHKDTFAGVKAVRNPSFNQSGVNKHWLIRMPPESLPENVTVLDNIQQHRLESLLAVDELIEKVLYKLKTLDVLDQTYIIFTSDNGFHIGQFSQAWDKRQPYETDIRVPFIIRGPNVPKKSIETFPISSVDIVPTILELADVAVPGDVDGVSFKKLLYRKESTAFTNNILIEYWGEGNVNAIDENCPWKYDPNLTQCALSQWCKCQDSRNNTYACILQVTESHALKFCQFYDSEHFIEVYNLTADPFELRNIAKELSFTTKQQYITILEKLQQCQGKSCQNAVDLKIEDSYQI